MNTSSPTVSLLAAAAEGGGVSLHRLAWLGHNHLHTVLGMFPSGKKQLQKQSQCMHKIPGLAGGCGCKVTSMPHQHRGHFKISAVTGTSACAGLPLSPAGPSNQRTTTRAASCAAPAAGLLQFGSWGNRPLPPCCLLACHTLCCSVSTAADTTPLCAGQTANCIARQLTAP